MRVFVYRSTTSAFGSALIRAAGTPAVWVTEETAPVAPNICGVTKLAAEGLCELFHQSARLPCLVLRTSRFFPEEDDRAVYTGANAKANELLYRCADAQCSHVRRFIQPLRNHGRALGDQSGHVTPER